MSEFERECVAGIEVHLFGRGSDRPVVFVTHGRGGKLAHTHALCRRLAAAGLTAVGVEQRNHGRRLVSMGANGYGPHHAADMYGILVGTAVDIGLLIDFLPARLGVETDRIGVTGVSLGGHAALMAMGLDPRITAGAAFIGSGDFRTLMESRHRLKEFRSLAWDEFYPPGLDAGVRRFDPVHRPRTFADRPLLMLNGAEDPLVPLDGNRRFEAAARPFYPHPEKLELRTYPGVGHQVTEAMEVDAVAWLGRWLAPPKESP